MVSSGCCWPASTPIDEVGGEGSSPAFVRLQRQRVLLLEFVTWNGRSLSRHVVAAPAVQRSRKTRVLMTSRRSSLVSSPSARRATLPTPPSSKSRSTRCSVSGGPAQCHLSGLLPPVEQPRVLGSTIGGDVVLQLAIEEEVDDIIKFVVSAPDAALSAGAG